MVYLQFLLTATIIVIAATKLSEYGDTIAVRTGMGKLFIGSLLLAGATSLPELLAGVNALQLREPDLAAGSFFGSGMFNIFMLGLLDLFFNRARLLRRVAATHALTASLGSLLTAMAALFILTRIDLPKIGWIGVDSLLIIAFYIGGISLLQGRGQVSATAEIVEIPESVPSLPKALLGFGFASLILVITTPTMVSSANQIAQITGIGVGFIGATLIAITTSLPELVATIAAARIGAYDLAVGNLFGSNIFNMFALGLTDLFYTPGRFLGAVDDSFAVIGLLVVILTCLGLIGNLARIERRILLMEVDALLILIGFFLGMYLLYVQGIQI
jgi:cation:H+ antiporter